MNFYLSHSKLLIMHNFSTERLQANTSGMAHARTSVTAEDLLVHDGGDGQAVKAVGERLPQLDVESAFTWRSHEEEEGEKWAEPEVQTEDEEINESKWLKELMIKLY